MKRFLFVIIDGGGNVASQMAVARRLAARGHNVHVLGDAGVEPAALGSGCRFHPFVHAPALGGRDRSPPQQQLGLPWLLPGQTPRAAQSWRSRATRRDGAVPGSRRLRVSAGPIQSRVLGTTSRTITQLPWPLGRS